MKGLLRPPQGQMQLRWREGTSPSSSVPVFYTVKGLWSQSSCRALTGLCAQHVLAWLSGKLLGGEQTSCFTALEGGPGARAGLQVIHLRVSPGRRSPARGEEAPAQRPASDGHTEPFRRRLGAGPRPAASTLNIRAGLLGVEGAWGQR